jgi:acyl-CoA thioesterase-1
MLFKSMAWLLLMLSLKAPAANEAPLILVFGDSLSAAYGMAPEQGWPHLLAERLRAEGCPHRVVNLSVSGETTAGGRSRLPAALEREKPALLLLALGANDGLRGLDLPAMRDNLAAMIENAQAAGAEVLLLGMRLPSNYGKPYTERFQRIYAELAKSFELAWLEFLLDGVALDPRLIMPDGLHPTAEAQPRILDNVWPLLRPTLVCAE